MENVEMFFEPNLYIHEWMKRQDMTQRDLCRKLGISDAAMSKLLHGKTQLTHRWMVEIAAALGREITDLYMHPDYPSADAKLRMLPPVKRDEAMAFINSLLNSE
jgi:transcriptional regulator with XRE-family HTH domain